MGDNNVTEQNENGQSLKANKRKRVIICVSVTLSVIGFAVLLGVVIGKAFLGIII